MSGPQVLPGARPAWCTKVICKAEAAFEPEGILLAPVMDKREPGVVLYQCP